MSITTEDRYFVLDDSCVIFPCWISVLSFLWHFDIQINDRKDIWPIKTCALCSDRQGIGSVSVEMEDKMPCCCRESVMHDLCKHQLCYTRVRPHTLMDQLPGHQTLPCSHTQTLVCPYSIPKQAYRQSMFILNSGLQVGTFTNFQAVWHYDYYNCFTALCLGPPGEPVPEG